MLSWLKFRTDEFAIDPLEPHDVNFVRRRMQLIGWGSQAFYNVFVWALSGIYPIPQSIAQRYLLGAILGIPLVLSTVTNFKHRNLVFQLTVGFSILAAGRRGISALESGNFIEFYPAFAAHIVAALLGGFTAISSATLAVFTCMYCMIVVSFFYACPSVPSESLHVILFGVLGLLVPIISYAGFTRSMEQIIIRQAESLRLARDEALEMSKLKSQFVATMSHEIRTPLNGVIGLTEMLLRTQLNNDQRHWVENVQTSGRVLLSLANQVLDFSKIEAGKLELRREEMNLRQTLEDVIQVCGVNTQDGVEMVSYVDPQLPETVVGDDTRIQQILVNLVGNATKFTHKGQIEVMAEVVDDSEAAQELSHATESEKEVIASAFVGTHSVFMRVRVRDTGIGLTHAQSARLFQAFTQADSSTTRKYGGSGLGLVIAQRLTNMMGGRISVTSAVGAGSEFSVLVRLQLKSPYVPNAQRVSQQLRGLSVGVVSRNMNIAEFYACTLRDYGAEVTTVCVPATASPEEIVASLNARDVSCRVLLVDIGAGASTIEELEKLYSGSVIEVVSRTSLNSTAEFALHKPVRSSVLVNTVLASLVSRKAIAEATTSESPPTPTSIRPGVRVLLAEDYPVNQMVMKLMLGKLGCEVDIADDGAIALQKFQTSSDNHSPYDVVLMDMQMPVMDGMEATKAIREFEKTRGFSIPIIAVTASASVDESVRCLASGMDDHISKPVSLLSLTAVLRKWC